MIGKIPPPSSLQNPENVDHSPSPRDPRITELAREIVSYFKNQGELHLFFSQSFQAIEPQENEIVYDEAERNDEDFPLTEEQIKENFYQDLSKWERSLPAQRNKKEAASRIREVFENRTDTLSLANLELTSLPKSIRYFFWLKEIDLSYNKLVTLSDSFLRLVHLKNLKLTHNDFSSLPENIGNLKSLQKLELDRNYLTSLPESFCNLSILESLDISLNGLSSLPESIGKLASLKKLFLNKNHLSSLPESFGNLSILELLDLYQNRLASLPESIGNLAGLKKLKLSDNQISSLPKNFGNLLSIEQIDLSKNLLASLPKSIGNLQTLKEIDLSQNRLYTLPKRIVTLSNLTSLSLHDNQLTHIPYSIGKLSKLESLHLTTNHLTSIPQSIGRLSSLELLYLWKNKLAFIPESLGNLTGLIELDLGGNRLSSLPENIGNLTRLRKLSLGGNRLSSLPESIGNLTRLRKLDLDGNCLPSLPKTLEKLSKLEYLFLRHNHLSSLFETIGNLFSLEHLELSNNQLTSLPESIGNCSKMKILQSEYNQLSSLPSHLGSLSKLYLLAIHHNPQLNELPLSLGYLPELSHIDIEGTNILPSQLDSILAQCRATRHLESSHTLPCQLDSWKTYAKGIEDREYHLDFILTDLSEDQKRDINEWLFRLSKTQDFRYHQQTLAHLACSILETLKDNMNFREIFFPQISGDFERCDDRTAQSFNETYTSWRLHTIDKEGSLKDKIKLLEGLAKTGELRDRIKKIIEEKNKNYAEQVELVLYFEALLKDDLGLVSAITHRHYTPPLESLNWFDIEELKKTVNANYKTSVVRSNDFQKLAKQDASYSAKIMEISNSHDEKMNQLFSDKDSMKEGEWKDRMDGLVHAKQKALDSYAIEWATL